VLCVRKGELPFRASYCADAQRLGKSLGAPLPRGFGGAGLEPRGGVPGATPAWVAMEPGGREPPGRGVLMGSSVFPGYGEQRSDPLLRPEQAFDEKGLQ